MWLRFIAFPLALLAGLVAVGILAVALVVALAYPNLPTLEALTEYQPKIPLRIYTADGVLRAAYTNLVSGGRRQGASTITMQVARNFFLSSEKTLTRKLYEALLAFKIEHS